VRVFAVQLDIHIHDSQSLKDKRRVVKSLVESLKSKFNVSVVEVDYLDKWQRALIGVAWISHDGRGAESYLSEILQVVDSRDGVERIGTERFDY